MPNLPHVVACCAVLCWLYRIWWHHMYGTWLYRICTTCMVPDCTAYDGIMCMVPGCTAYHTHRPEVCFPCRLLRRWASCVTRTRRPCGPTLRPAWPARCSLAPCSTLAHMRSLRGLTMPRGRTKARSKVGLCALTTRGLHCCTPEPRYCKMRKKNEKKNEKMGN